MKRRLFLWAVVLGLLFAISGALLWPREAQAQTAGLCGAGRPCGVRTLTAQGMIASLASSGAAAFRSASGALWCFDSGCVNNAKDNSNVEAIFSKGIRSNGSYLRALYLSLDGAAESTFGSPVAAGKGVVETGTTLGHLWYSDGAFWHDFQSGAHQVFDGATFRWTAPRAATATACPLHNGAEIPAAGGAATTITCSGAGTSYSNNGRNFALSTTGAVAGNQASITTTPNGYMSCGTTITNGARWCEWVSTPATITSIRIFAGMGNADPTSSSTLSNAVAFRYSTDDTDPAWMVCTHDGTTQTCTSTGVAVSASTNYLLCLDWRKGGTNFYATAMAEGSAPATINKTTNLPAVCGGTAHVFNFVETRTTAARSMGWGNMAAEFQQ